MNSSNNNCTLPPDFDQHSFPALYIIVIAISIPANCASLVVSCLHIKKKNELGVYLFNLSLADLLFTMTLPLWVDYFFNHDNWRFNSFLCKLSAVLIQANFYASAGFLTCISLDRYLAVVHPMKYHLLRTRKTAMCICVIVWLLELSENGIILSNRPTLIKMANHSLCYDVFLLEPWKASFNIVHTCIGFLLPLVIMAFCYQRIDAAVKQNQATATDAKRKIRKLLICILATFFLCFTPYHVIILMWSILEQGNCGTVSWIFRPYKITLAIANLNCVADPILYCFVSETSRKEFAAMVKCCREKDQIPAKEDLEMAPISKKNIDETMPTLEDF